MGRNRRNQSAAVRLGPALKVVLFCIFFGGSALGYVWQKKQIYELGREIKECEDRLEALRMDNQRRQDQLAYLCSHRNLAQRVKELGLNLEPPSAEQIIRLREEPAISGLESQPDRLASPAIR